MRRLVILAVLLVVGCHPGPSTEPAAAVTIAPVFPVVAPTPSPPQISSAEAARKEAARQEAMRQETVRLAAAQAERERQDAERQAQEEAAAEAKRSHAAYSLLTKDEQAVADHIMQELSDPNGQGLPPNIQGAIEYTMLKRHWGDGLFDTKKGRADVVQFAWTSGFDKVSAEIGWKPTDAGLSEAALEWFFLNPEFSLNPQSTIPPREYLKAVIKQYQQLGYDKMHPKSREFMLDHPVLFRPILKARMGS